METLILTGSDNQGARMGHPKGADSIEDARESLRRAIQDLHRSAGLPSSRAISVAVRDRDDLRDTVSHETVNAILRGEIVPKWVKLESVARQLADWAAHRPDPDLAVREIQDLWLACQPPRGGGGSAASQRQANVEIAEITARTALEKSLVVLDENASLYYHGDAVEVTVTRHVLNQGEVPIREYAIKVVVDRYPEEPEKSRNHHQKHSLAWSDLSFEGYCDGKPMAWRSYVDRRDTKGIDLLFENDEELFPVLPGSSAVLSYSYRVPTEIWGPWFQRKINFPTRRIMITLNFPASSKPVAWGERVDPLRNEGRTRVPLLPETGTEGRIVFKWIPKEISFRSAYRVAWGFRAPNP